MAAINQVGNSLTGLTGTGTFVGANTPTLITPVLGAATGTSVVLSGKLTANNSIAGFATTATAGATTTLTVSSAQNQEFTGTLTQTVVMPVTSTLVTGQQYYIINNSSGAVTVQSSGANTIQVMDTNTSLLLTVVNTAVTSASGWESAYIPDTGLAGAVLLAPTGDQTITNGFALIVSAGGEIQASSGNIVAGSSGFQGNFIAFPPTAASGVLEIAAADSAGMFTGLLTNTSLSAARTWTLPDATGTIALTGSASSGYVLLAPAGNQTITTGNLSLTTGNYIAGTVLPGNLSLTGNTISSTNSNGNINLLPNGTGAVCIGSTAPVLATPVALSIARGGNAGVLELGSFLSSVGSGSSIYFIKSRSDVIGSFSAVQNGDTLGNIQFNGDDGTQYLLASLIQSRVQSTVSTGIVPTALYFSTTSQLGVLTLGMTLDSAQSATFANNVSATLGIYASGSSAGGVSGKFQAFSTTAALGSTSLTAANNAGNFSNVLTNASTTAARTWTLPDATGTIALTADITSTAVVLNPVADQNILAHNLVLAAGGVTTTDAIQSLTGDLISGSDANPGILTSFPPTTTSGTLSLVAANNAGAFANVLTNASTTGVRTWTLPDATGTIALQGGALSATSISSAPAASQSSSLALGSAYQNTFGYDVVLTVYLVVTAATAGTIALGVGSTNTPTQQNIVTGFTIAALSVIPVTIYLPKNYYALLSLTSVTATISGQQAMPV